MTGPTLPPLPAPTPVDVGVVAALPIEIGAFRDRLKDVRTFEDVEGRRAAIHEGDLGAVRVAFVVGGVGAESARKSAGRLLAGHRPRWLISAGFCGALDPNLARGDVLVLREVVDGAAPGAARLRIDFGGLDRPGGEPGRRFLSGSLVTVANVVRTASDKAQLRQSSGADAVDMETFAVASFCADRGHRFLGVRAVSDHASEELPPEVLTILGPTGGFRLGATLGSLWKRPSSAKDLWRLYEHATNTAERLADALALLIPSLIGPTSP